MSRMKLIVGLLNFVRKKRFWTWYLRLTFWVANIFKKVLKYQHWVASIFPNLEIKVKFKLLFKIVSFLTCFNKWSFFEKQILNNFMFFLMKLFKICFSKKKVQTLFQADHIYPLFHELLCISHVQFRFPSVRLLFHELLEEIPPSDLIPTRNCYT